MRTLLKLPHSEQELYHATMTWPQQRICTDTPGIGQEWNRPCAAAMLWDRCRTSTCCRDTGWHGWLLTLGCVTIVHQSDMNGCDQHPQAPWRKCQQVHSDAPPVVREAVGPAVTQLQVPVPAYTLSVAKPCLAHTRPAHTQPHSLLSCPTTCTSLSSTLLAAIQL